MIQILDADGDGIGEIQDMWKDMEFARNAKNLSSIIQEARKKCSQKTTLRFRSLLYDIQKFSN